MPLSLLTPFPRPQLPSHLFLQKVISLPIPFNVLRKRIRLLPSPHKPLNASHAPSNSLCIVQPISYHGLQGDFQHYSPQQPW